MSDLEIKLAVCVFLEFLVLLLMVVWIWDIESRIKGVEDREEQIVRISGKQNDSIEIMVEQQNIFRGRLNDIHR